VGLVDLTDEELAGVHPQLTPEVRSVLTVQGAVASRATRGGTAGVRVAEQLGRVVDRAAADRTWAGTPVRS
jgi:argininosuccinate lyase